MLLDGNFDERPTHIRMDALINIDEVPVRERQHARAGLFRSQELLHGSDGTPENFYLQLSYTYNDFFSPRHRHNFDQVRIQLRGNADFGRDGVMRPGTIGYFPEGVYYGPQTIAGESSTLVLQFGGASGSGYVSERRFQQAVEELKAYGSFANGVFCRTKEGGGRKSQDAYEAVWEHIYGRRMEYAKAEHEQPVFRHPDDFAWAEEPGLAGVLRKVLGVFSARKTRISVLAMDARACAPLAPNSIGFVLAGAGGSDGKLWRRHATFKTGDTPATLIAGEMSEVLEIHIPPLKSA